jgi:hypothetical protein
MALDIMFTRSDRYVNKSVSELQKANCTPIDGYEDQILMALENAVEKIAPFIDGIAKYVDDAKQKCNRHSNILAWDESAAIYLYTMSTPVYKHLNKTLRAENRNALKPWFAFLKLLMAALKKLPSSAVTVCRAVSGEIVSFGGENNVEIWWSVNSTSLSKEVIEMYLSDTGTLFAIDAIHGKNISEYSAYPDEQEVILMPGTRLRLKSNALNYKNYLLVVLLKEEPTTATEQTKPR